VKQQGKPNDLIERIKGREFFQPILPELQALLDPSTFTGRSSQIVEEVVSVNVAAALEKYAEDLKKEVDAELKV
jgi:adenylosuccinate lyase